MGFYWPAVLVLTICFLATLYHVSVPVRTNWTFNLPGATFSLALLDRRLLPAARVPHRRPPADSRSIYGPLAAPIAVLLWLYLLALAVLIGAAVNASFDTGLPAEVDHLGPPRARAAAAQQDGARGPRPRPAEGQDAGDGGDAPPGSTGPEGLDSGRAGRPD